MKSKLVERSSQVISVVFHPIFMVVYALLYLLMTNPYLFSTQEPKELSIVIMYIVIISVVFPGIAIGMLYNLGMIQSISMPERKQRIVPLIITATFYCWLYINLLNNNSIPAVFQSFVLGTNIGLFVGFFITLFNKVSLHSIAISGLTTGLIIAHYIEGYEYFELQIGQMNIGINSILPLAILVVFVGMVASARLYLNRHTIEQILGGTFIGILSQLIAMRFLL